jgi:hypothetical protein
MSWAAALLRICKITTNAAVTVIIKRKTFDINIKSTKMDVCSCSPKALV